jgi:proteasome lid subunit RPN8/RPN11
MQPATLSAAFAHAEAEYPRESCGLVVLHKGRERYWPCRNTAQDGLQFSMAQDDLQRAEDAAEIMEVVHSHPNVPALPSDADRVGCEASGVPWTILGWPSRAVHRFEPVGYVAPLVGRSYAYGILDCWTLVQDFFEREYGVTIRGCRSDFGWWTQGENLFVENFADAGFSEIREKDLKKGDVLFMKIFSPVPNHAAVYLGEQVILQHLANRLSTREVFGGYYRQATTHFLRHWSLA